MLRHYVNPRVPEAWRAQVLLGKAKLPKECFRNSYLERGVSQTPKEGQKKEWKEKIGEERKEERKERERRKRKKFQRPLEKAWLPEMRI